MTHGNMWVSSKYIVIMSFAAMVALLRGFIVAGILDLPSFGLYAAIISVGMFSSALVSFGEIERTIKTFPRLWVMVDYRRIVIDRADQSARIMTLRAAVFIIFLLTCTNLAAMRSFAQSGIFIVLIALSAAFSSLYASAIRATGDIQLLARNTLIRALIVLVFGLSGAHHFSWQGAILGDVLGTVAGVLITRYSVLCKIGYPDVSVKTSRGSTFLLAESDKGLWLFFAGLLASAPVYLDRAFVASVFGADTVGTFGFLLLFVTSANTFTGIIAQKVGPQLVKMQHLGGSFNSQITYARRWITLISIACTIGMIAATLLLSSGPGQYFYAKFNLNLHLLLAVAVLSSLQTGAILDFILISRNQERAVFVVSCWYIFAFTVAMCAVLWLKQTLVEFMWWSAFAKFIHITSQIVCIWRVGKIQSKGVI